MDVEQRLECLERSVRRWQTGALCATLAAAVALLSGWSRERGGQEDVWVVNVDQLAKAVANEVEIDWRQMRRELVKLMRDDLLTPFGEIRTGGLGSTPLRVQISP